MRYTGGALKRAYETLLIKTELKVCEFKVNEVFLTG